MVTRLCVRSGSSSHKIRCRRFSQSWRSFLACFGTPKKKSPLTSPHLSYYIWHFTCSLHHTHTHTHTRVWASDMCWEWTTRPTTTPWRTNHPTCLAGFRIISMVTTRLDRKRTTEPGTENGEVRWFCHHVVDHTGV